MYNESPILSRLIQYEDIPLRGNDIEKAKVLLAEAGCHEGVTVELTYSSDHPYSKELAQTIKELVVVSGFTIANPKINELTDTISAENLSTNEQLTMMGY